MKILIAEDDSTSRSINKNMLENFGNRVSTAENGLEAWELFQTDVFPLVITDWMMPEMNGLDFCRKIRDDQDAWHRLETYLVKHSGAQLSHSVCPTCLQKHYSDG